MRSKTERFNLVSRYLKNQTEGDWKQLVSDIVSDEMMPLAEFGDVRQRSRGWWELRSNAVLDDADCEHVARLIQEGCCQGEVCSIEEHIEEETGHA